MTITLNTQTNTALESRNVNKVREKILRSWEGEMPQVDSKNVQEVLHKIHKWIADNKNHRVRIKKSSIGLFNQNMEPAQVSKKVAQIAEKLKLR